jgi:hypothetical protein
LRREKERFLNETISLKEKIITLTRTNNEYEKLAYGNTTKNKLERTKVEALEDEIRHMGEDSKR